MQVEEVPFTRLLSTIVDNRGRTCPTAETGIPLIATNCVRNDILYPAFEKVRYVSKETYDTWFRGHPIPGDLIFVCKGTPGRVCITPDPVSFCIAQDMVAVRADPKKVYPKYLFALLRSSQVQTQISNLHVGTLIPHFKKGDFDKLLLPIPDKKTQETIGDTYFELSDKIELNRRMNATLESMARALFQSWFVDFDPVRAKLDGRQPAGMDQATAALFPEHFDHKDVSVVPTGWQASTLGEVIEISDAKRVPLSARERESRQGKYPYHGAASVMDYVDNFLFDGIYTLMGEDGSVINEDGTPVLQYVWGKFWVNNHAHVLRGKNGISTEHLLLHLKGSNIAAFVNGAVQPKLNQGNMNRIPFVLPPQEVGQAFAKAIDPLFAQIRANADQSRTLATLRDTLLPKLLSGELSVASVESKL
jgi:type I restriction enzyme S subunit